MSGLSWHIEAPVHQHLAATSRARSSLFNALKNKQVVQSKLKCGMLQQPEILGGKNVPSLADFVTVMFFQRHAINKP
jgi:hypothetical protein